MVYSSRLLRERTEGWILGLSHGVDVALCRPRPEVAGTLSGKTYALNAGSSVFTVSASKETILSLLRSPKSPSTRTLW